MSCSPPRLQGRLLSSKYGDSKETTPDGNTLLLSSSPTTSPKNDHHEQHRSRRQRYKIRSKATLLAVTAAATVGGFAVASSGLFIKTSPGVAAGLGRDLEQEVVNRNATSPHGQAALGNDSHSVMAPLSDERAARKEPHKLVEHFSKVWRRESLPPVGNVSWVCHRCCGVDRHPVVGW